MITREDALEYHARGRSGKIARASTNPIGGQSRHRRAVARAFQSRPSALDAARPAGHGRALIIKSEED